MASRDRCMIAGLLAPHFPTMLNATSDEWHGFLNAKTGLDVPLDEPNATAFDKWRQALAEQFNIPVWSYTSARIAAMKARGEELMKEEQARVAALDARLAFLSKAAPTKTAEDLINEAKALA